MDFNNVNAWCDRAPELVEATVAMVRRYDRWGMYTPKPLWSPEGGQGFTDQVLVNHFRGEPGKRIGLACAGPKNLVTWGVFDFDQHNDDGDEPAADRNFRAASHYAQALTKRGFFPLIEDSNGKGSYKVWIFLEEPRYTWEVQTFVQNFTNTHFEPAGLQQACEAFPKNQKIREGTPCGHYVRLPGRHPKHTDHWSRFHVEGEWRSGGDAVQAWIDRDTTPPEVTDRCIPRLPEPREYDRDIKLSNDEANDALKAIGNDRIQEQLRKVIDSLGEVSEGNRHETLYYYACLLVKDYALDQETATNHLRAVNQEKCKPPLPDQEISKQIKSAIKYGRNKRGCALAASRRQFEVEEASKIAESGDIDQVFDAAPKFSAMSLAEYGKAKAHMKKRLGSQLNLRDLDRAVKEARPHRAKETPQDSPESPYKESADGLIYHKETSDGSIPVRLTNFTARIIRNVIRDDGVERTQGLEIEAHMGGRRFPFQVPASRFTAMNWPIEQMGPKAIIYPGFSIKEHARAAIQLLSPDPTQLTVYSHTGWRKIGSRWVYLHAGGAVGPDGPDGPVSDVEVGLENLGLYQLPSPPHGEGLVRAVKASLALIDLAPDRITVPLLAMIYRAALRSCDFSGHIAGDTGAFKTELAALAQQHYGPAMDARHLPGSWSSTANALEVQAFTAKDALLVVDDFSPTGSPYDVQKTHREADRIIRAQGNRSGRGRLRSDASPRATKAPRGLILATGEDIPRGKSCRARLFIVEVADGDIKPGKLSQCQQDAAAGFYAQAMAGFIQWVAKNYDRVQEQISSRVVELRTQAYRSKWHSRMPTIISELMVGLECFFSFAHATGAIARDEAPQLRGRCWDALVEAAAAQRAYQAGSDPVLRYLELLGSAIASGNAHVADPKGDEPDPPGRWGWRAKTIGTGDYQRDEWQPQGERVGWIDGNNLYLDPLASYKAAQRMGTGGEGLVVTEQTLRKRLFERGVLQSVERDADRFTIRRELQGTRRRIIHVDALAVLTQKVVQVVQVGQDPLSEPKNGDSGPVSRTSFGPGGVPTGPQPGPQTSDGAAVGPDGPDGPVTAQDTPQTDESGGAPGEDEEQVVWTG